MVQGIADVFGDRRFAGDTCELLFEPGFECQHQRLALFLANRLAFAGTAAPDRLLDGIEGRDAFERFAGNRSRAALGDVEESAPQMGPAKGKRVSERMCKQVSVSLPYRGDSHDDQYDDYTGTAGSTACSL